ncbi:hypothetical protein CRYUN_Cryun09bG0037700 [Craigia yunnanensis]
MDGLGFLLMDGLGFDSSEIIVDCKFKATFVSLASLILGGESVLSEINYLYSLETLGDVKPVTHLAAVDVTSKKDKVTS